MWRQNASQEDCLLAERFAHSATIATIECVQVLMSFGVYALGIAIIYELCRNPPAFHTNFKILLTSWLGFSFIFASTCTVSTIYTSYRIASYDDPCDLLIPTWVPVVVRAPVYFYIYGTAFLHVALFCERLIATYCCRTYETAGNGCGIFTEIALWIIAALSYAFVFGGEDLSSYRTFISSTSPGNANKVFMVSSLCACLDLMSCVSNYILYRKNKSLQQSQSKWLNYQLGRGYQLKENLRTVSLMFRMSVVHSGIYLMYSLSNSAVRIWFDRTDEVMYVAMLEACLTIISIHTVVMMGMLHYFLKFSKRKRKLLVEDIYLAKDIYFVQLREQLEGPAVTRVLLHNLESTRKSREL